LEWREALAFACLGKPKLSGPNIAAFLTLTPPDRRRRDIDNVLKTTFDGLIHAGVIEDDAFVKVIAASVLPPRRPGEVKVVLMRLPAPPVGVKATVVLEGGKEVTLGG